MALSGLHVAFGYAGSPAPGGMDVTALSRNTVASETLTNPGATTITAPAGALELGQAVASLRCSVDAWIAIGPNPNASANPRRYLSANTDFDIFVFAGDKVAWAAA